MVTTFCLGGKQADLESHHQCMSFQKEQNIPESQYTVLGIPGIFPAFSGKNECGREGVDQTVASVPGFVNSSLWESLLGSAQPW